MKKFLLFTVLAGCLFMGTFALAETITLPNPLCLGQGGAGPCSNNFIQLIDNITSYVLTIVGSIAVIIFVYAGFLFLTSAGDPGKIGRAKQALLYAVIGLIIAFAGRGLVMVIQEVIGANPPPA